MSRSKMCFAHPHLRFLSWYMREQGTLMPCVRRRRMRSFFGSQFVLPEGHESVAELSCLFNALKDRDIAFLPRSIAHKDPRDSSEQLAIDRERAQVLNNNNHEKASICFCRKIKGGTRFIERNTNLPFQIAAAEED